MIRPFLQPARAIQIHAPKVKPNRIIVYLRAPPEPTPKQSCVAGVVGLFPPPRRRRRRQRPARSLTPPPRLRWRAVGRGGEVADDGVCGAAGIPRVGPDPRGRPTGPRAPVGGGARARPRPRRRGARVWRPRPRRRGARVWRPRPRAGPPTRRRPRGVLGRRFGAPPTRPLLPCGWSARPPPPPPPPLSRSSPPPRPAPWSSPARTACG